MNYKERFWAAINNISFGNLDSYEENIKRLVGQFLIVRKNGGKAFFAGNGGSAGIAEHMTADFLKNGKIRTHSLYEASTLTCLGNDYGYEFVFSKQLEIMVNAGDLLVAISSSGRSQNILNAVGVAKKNGGEIITLTGFDADNPLRRMGDISAYVPSNEYGIVESAHNLILQQVVDEIFALDCKEGA